MERTTIKIASIVFMLTLAATAQESRSEIALQGSGLFTQDASGQGLTRHVTDTGGLLVSYRYHLNRWLSAEAAYVTDEPRKSFLRVRVCTDSKPTYIK